MKWDWDDFLEKALRVCRIAIIPVAVLWCITGIIAVIVYAMGL